MFLPNLLFLTRPVQTAFLVLALLSCLAACVPTTTQLSRSDIVAAVQECGSSGADAGCYFRNSPVRLQNSPQQLPGRPYTFYPTAEPMFFVDGTGREWHAPRSTLTDGASIPPVFVPLLGEPNTPEFANAAAVHDAYCGVGNDLGQSYHRLPWQDVHRMFYDSLIVGGTAVGKAQVMFAAVWLGGPRWHPVTRADDTRMERVAKNLQQEIMLETKTFIEQEKPDLPRLIRYLEWQEQKLMWRNNQGERPARSSALQSPF